MSEWIVAESGMLVCELVRCKDCRFGDNFDGAFVRCLNDGNEEEGWNHHYADWFCADGERKEKDDE